MASSVDLAVKWIGCACGAALLLATIGCGQRGANELVGKWKGRPDTAEWRAQRDQMRFGSGVTDEASVAPARADAPTDWESYDVSVSLEFIDRKRARMQMNDAPPVEAQWSVVQQGPASVVVEFATAARAEDEAPRGGTDGVDDSATERRDSATVRRRFELLTDRRDGTLEGFVFAEVGADRRLGTLYFERVGKE
ncbi:MAG: hypothetical protein KDA61_17320 [Planctomycetales bacterium]|nr:hypothetical protein [Planctomycetales bacterium]